MQSNDYSLTKLHAVKINIINSKTKQNLTLMKSNCLETNFPYHCKFVFILNTLHSIIWY